LGEVSASSETTSEYGPVTTPDTPPIFPAVTSFDTAAAELQTLIDWAKGAEHRVGYFAAVYKRVTLALKQAAADGAFEDADRMSELAGIFATRYLMAVNAFFHPGEFTLSDAWRASFDQFDNAEAVIVQHIQGGINAHTSFDLGMAVNQITGSRNVQRIRKDFYAVNAVLASQAHDMVDKVEEISPHLREILAEIPGDEAQLIGPAITWMRELAWKWVEWLEVWPGTENILPSEVQDKFVYVSTVPLFNGLLSEFFNRIAAHESRDVRRNIEVLDRVADDVDNIKTTL
jgi:hypothetical protein